MKSQTIVFLTVSAVLVVLCVAWHEIFIPDERDESPRSSITANSDPETAATSSESSRALNVLERKAPELVSLFEGDDWRVGANLIKIPKASLYFLFKGEPGISEDGKRLSLNACTVVWLPRAKKDDAEEGGEESLESRVKRAYLFEVSDQIILNFSRSLLEYHRLLKEEINLSLLESGRLVGQVVMRGGDETNAKDLAFYIQTRDVVFNTRQFRAASDVVFRFGSHSGTGEGLTVDFETPELFERRARKKADSSKEDEEEQTETSAREQALAKIDEIVDSGNLGDGFSIRQVEVNKLKDYMRFDLTAFRDRDDGDEDGRLDRLDVNCRGGAHFEPTSHKPGEWCVRFDDDVSAIAWRQSERACVFKGESFYLYFQDPVLEELEKTSPEAFRELRRRNPSGALARLEPSVLRVLGDEKPVSLQYRTYSADENEFPTELKLEATQAYYDAQHERLILSDRLELEAPTPTTPTPVRFEIVKYDAETKSPVTSTLTSPTMRIEMDLKKRALRSLSAIGAGSLSSFLNAGDGRRVSLQAFWTNGLQLDPDETAPDAYLLTSSGETRCNVEGFGSFQAAEANFWFWLDASALNQEEPVAAGEQYRRANAKGRIAQSAEERSASFGSSGIGFAPICAKFSKDVVFRGADGASAMNVGDSVTVRFSDQSGTNAPRSGLNLAKKTFRGSDSARLGTSRNGADRGATGKSRSYRLACDRLEAWCDLEPPSGEDGNIAGAPTFHFLNVALNGNVSFVGFDENGNESASLAADSVVAENPLTDSMRLLFYADSGTARLRANELALSGKKAVVDMSDNSFQVEGSGEVAIFPPRKETDSSVEGDSAAPTVAVAKSDGAASLESVAGALTDPIFISWTKAMVFDGKTMSFQSEDGSLVELSTVDASVRCAETRLTLKNRVDLLNLQFNEKSSAPEIDHVECLGAGLERPAVLSFSKRGEETTTARSDYDGFYRMICQHVRVDLETSEFTINDGGLFDATLLSKSGVSELGADALEKKNEPTRGVANEKEERWVRISARFSGAEGSFKDGSGKIEGGVNALICDVPEPSSVASIDDPSAWPDGSATFRCRDAFFHELRGGATGGDFEIEARGDVTFRMDDLSGYCESFGYVASKRLATLSGTENSMATLERQEYSGAPRVKVAEFMTGRVHLDTRKFEVEDLTYADSLDDSSIFKKRGAKGERNE